MTNLDACMAVGCELRPVSGDRRVHIQLATIHQHQGASAVMVSVTDQVTVMVSRTQCDAVSVSSSSRCGFWLATGVDHAA
jgi:hypothetical protein